MSADWQQQVELEAERLQRELDALKQIDHAGMHDLAAFLAADLGITKEFQREIQQ